MSSMGNAMGTVGTGMMIANMVRGHNGGHGAPQAAAQKRALESAGKCPQNIIVCNAFASPQPLTMVRVRTDKRSNSSQPLNYKECRELKASLKDGDKIEFQDTSVAVGTFNVNKMPTHNVTMLLIIARRHRASGASFVSHAFQGESKTEAAVIDVYHRGDNSTNVTERLLDGRNELRFASAVPLPAGRHEFVLSAADGTRNLTTPLPLEVPGDAASVGSKYLLMRVGGASFPQELVAFNLPRPAPCSESSVTALSKELAAAQHSGATAVRASALGTLLTSVSLAVNAATRFAL